MSSAEHLVDVGRFDDCPMFDALPDGRIDQPCFYLDVVFRHTFTVVCPVAFVCHDECSSSVEHLLVGREPHACPNWVHLSTHLEGGITVYPLVTVDRVPEVLRDAVIFEDCSRVWTTDLRLTIRFPRLEQFVFCQVYTHSSTFLKVFTPPQSSHQLGVSFW